MGGQGVGGVVGGLGGAGVGAVQVETWITFLMVKAMLGLGFEEGGGRDYRIQGDV